jgi:Zn-dependent protease with chaperone function
MDRRQASRRIVFAAVLALFFAGSDARADVRDGDPPVATSTAPVDELRPVAVPAPSADAVRFHQTGNWLWAFGQLWALAVPAAILFSGLSARLRTVARRIGRTWFFTIGVYALLYFTLVFVVDLPLAYYAGFVRQHAYGLSHQSLERWGRNALIGLGVDLVGAVLFLWVPYLLLARSPRRWWITTTVLSVPFSFFVMLIAPIWIDPLFNKFGPMKDPALERRIAALADRAGISEGRIYEVDKSADSRALNAYVKGFLNTKRIVLYDTLLAQLDDREVLAVMGHEMGHYALGHVNRSILLSSLVVLICLFVVDRAGRWVAGRFSRRFGFDTLADVASLPLLFLLLQLTGLAVAPVVMAYSRAQEHEADVFALELTQTNHSAAAAFAKLQQENLGVPWHGVLEKLWRSTHPSIGERIEFCNDYHPWTEGRPLLFGAYFRPGPQAAADAEK